MHLLFHPRSDSARSLAERIHQALNDDAALPGLRVPTVLAREDGTGLPPVNIGLDQAQRNLLIVLADDSMLIEPDEVPAGRKTWTTFVGDLWEGCRSSQDRFLPVQLSESAWGFDPRLEGINFLRAYLQGDLAWTLRALVVETCRYLLGLKRGTQLPVRVFLSHAKQDVDKEPKIFREVSQYLDVTKPVEAWVDSAKIPGGSSFAQEIEKGASESALLVLATDSYSSRTWCRREILIAKEHRCPIVVVDALQGLDRRSFPYAGNVPAIRWTPGGAERVVDLLLKETLRHWHTELVLDATKGNGDSILTSAPELATVVALPAGTTVLYPDPPLGDEELAQLAPLGHSFATPLQNAGRNGVLKEMAVAIATSESDDSRRFGVFDAHREGALMEISRQLLVRGATLHYGGHLGSDGYTTALFDMAQAYRAQSGLPPAERIVNDVGWPLPLETLPDATRAKYQNVAKFRRVPRPAGVEDLEPATFVAEPAFFPADSPARRFAWARGMTAMREDQTRRTRARVVLGGKVGPTVTAKPDGGKDLRWYMSRIPGVVEEAYASIQAEKPLYLVGGFGGAAALVGDLLEGRPRPADFTWDYHRQAPHAETMRDLYATRGVPWLDYTEIAADLGTRGLAALSRVNGLSVAENRELLGTRDVSRIVELVVQGLGTL